MTELETVLKNLHDLRKYLEDKEWSDELAAPYINTVMKAEELLKKQVPMTIISKKVSYYGAFIYGNCPCCGKEIIHWIADEDVAFCKECGQEVKWE